MGKNKELGLPFGEGMEKVAVCFDVDGTLFDQNYPHGIMLTLLTMFATQKWKNLDIIVWSGGGGDYAESMVRRFNVELTHGSGIKFYSKLEHEAIRARYDKIIAIDDIQDTRLGDINLIVRNK